MIKLENGGVTIELPKDIGEIKNIINYINCHKVIDLTIVMRKESSNITIAEPDAYSLEFLNDIEKPENIKKLSLLCEFKDCSPIHKFVNLEELSSSLTWEKLIDISKFPKLHKLSAKRLAPFMNLEKCSARWLNYGDIEGKSDCEMELLQQMTKLDNLRLSRLKKFNIEELATLQNLSEIWLTQCDISSLFGIKKLQSLAFVVIGHCNKLVQIDEAVQLPNLEVLWLDSCSKLKYASAIGKIKTLRMLILENVKLKDYTFIEEMACKATLKCLMLQNCGEIKSIKFFSNYPKLQAFCGYDTNIIDGDITPCLKLESASVSNKRHYNLRKEKLPFGKGFYKWLRE